MKLMSMSLMFVGLLSSAQPVLAQERVAPVYRTASVNAPDPALQMRELVRVLRANDVAALVRAVVPPANYQKMRLAYELQRSEPSTEKQRVEFAEGLAKLTAPDAVDKMMLQIEPKLVEARPKVAGALMMGMGALQVAVASEDSELTAAERASLQSALPGVQRWATSTDFLSSLAMRQALTLLADAARSTGVRGLDEFKMLSFEQALTRAGNMLAASKQALQLYGLDLNAIADSLQVQVLEVQGGTARVRTTVMLFDAPISSEHELVLLDGRWYGKRAVEQWTKHAEKQARS